MVGEALAPVDLRNRRLRIAVVAACPFPAPRGTPLRIERLAAALGARGHQIDVLTYHLGADCPGQSFAVHRIAHVSAYQRTAPGPSWRKLLQIDPMLAAKVAARCRVERYDIIHAHHVEGLLTALPASRQFKIPLVYDVHTLLKTELPYYEVGLGPQLLRGIGGFTDRWLPRLADHIVSVSPTITECLRRDARIRSDRIDTIPNGVESLFFDAEREAAGDAPSLVYAGNLARYQGIEFLLRAFAHGRGRRPDLRLRILSNDRFDAYETLAAMLGVRQAIEICAVSVAELPSRLAQADVAVNPRVDCAGLPQKLVNYMAAGCPIVSYQGSAKHLIHGRTGLIVSDHDIEGLGEAALQLIDDRPLARRLGLAARNYARAEFDWARAAERVETIYLRLLGTTRR
jgi:glycosyltransferase involved in cell wall biosynthesis